MISDLDPKNILVSAMFDKYYGGPQSRKALVESCRERIATDGFCKVVPVMRHDKVYVAIGEIVWLEAAQSSPSFTITVQVVGKYDDEDELVRQMAIVNARVPQTLLQKALLAVRLLQDARKRAKARQQMGGKLKGRLGTGEKLPATVAGTSGDSRDEVAALLGMKGRSCGKLAYLGERALDENKDHPEESATGKLLSDPDATVNGVYNQVFGQAKNTDVVTGTSEEDASTSNKSDDATASTTSGASASKPNRPRKRTSRWKRKGSIARTAKHPVNAPSAASLQELHAAVVLVTETLGRIVDETLRSDGALIAAICLEAMGRIAQFINEHELAGEVDDSEIVSILQSTLRAAIRKGVNDGGRTKIASALPNVDLDAITKKSMMTRSENYLDDRSRRAAIRTLVTLSANN